MLSSQAKPDDHPFLFQGPATDGHDVADRRSCRGVVPLFHVAGSSITQIGSVASPDSQGYGAVQRSLVIGSTLWTVSANGLMASDINSVHQIRWVPLNQK